MNSGPPINPFLHMKLTRIALSTGVALLLNALISAQDCARVQLTFEPQQAVLNGASWHLLDGLGYVFRQASFVDVSVSVPKGFFIPDHGQDIYSLRMALVQRWMGEEAVDLAKVTFRKVLVPYGEARADVVLQHDGCVEAKYRPPYEPDTVLVFGPGVELRCKIRDAAAFGGVRIEGLNWAEEAMGMGWPATEVVGGQRDVVGLAQIHLPDSARHLPHRIQFPLPDGAQIRRGELMIPTPDGLVATDVRLRLKAEDGTDFAQFEAPHSGPLAIVAPAARAAEEAFVEVLAPDGWIFEHVAWRSPVTWHALALGESPYRARFPDEAVSEAHAYQFRIRSPEGQVLELPWGAWADLPWSVRPLPRIRRPGQFDAELLLFNPQTPILCRLPG